MRFESIDAESFGPLRDARLELSDGMNVVYGLNESGKSSWHAALYVALCGMRRGKGRPSSGDQAFANQYTPWSGDPWRVRCVVSLADGRRVELAQHLGNKEGKAHELGRGIDVTDTIMHEGMPDGARWLGLDRNAFAHTACIRQAEIVSVVDGAEEMREHLQRAAATTRHDATASAALDRIKVYRKERVGTTRPGGKPLRASLDELDEARSALEQARELHACYADLAREAASKRLEVDEAARNVRAAVAARERRAAEQARDHFERVSKLATKFADGAPGGPLADDDLADDVARALVSYGNCPKPMDLKGADAAALQRQLDELSEPPTGDVEPASVVVEAFDELEAARAGVATSAGDGQGRRARPFLLLGMATALIGVALAALVSPIAGGVVAAAGVAVAVLGLVRQSRALGDRMGPSGAVESRERALVAALRTRGVEIGPNDDALYGYESYLDSCRRQAIRAQSRSGLESALNSRRSLENAAAENEQMRDAAVHGLRKVAALCSIEASDPDAIVRSLESWQSERRIRREQEAEQRDDWVELQRLLGDESLADLATKAIELELEAGEKAAGLSEDAIATFAGSDNLDDLVKSMEEELRSSEHESATLRGQVKERSVPSVPEAEERVERAEREHDRVQRLDRTLALAVQYLGDAQDKVHRDIAPVLAEFLGARIGPTTGGRYREAMVDPESLDVKVRDGSGDWRPAKNLSQGTTEQVYLLLRIAMAEHLTVQGEACPLILDDVLVQFDGERSIAVLDLLHEISRDHQVIVFSQEDDVKTWAEDHLAPPRDRLELLDRIAPHS